MVELKDFHAKIFLEENQLDIRQAEGVLAGLHVAISGVLALPEPKPEDPQQPSPGALERLSAMRQHREMVQAYEEAGVTVHLLEPDEALPYQVYARDSSFMTPYGAVVTQMHQWWRRGEYAPVIQFYQSKGIPIFKMITASAFEGGDFDVIEPKSVLIGFPIFTVAMVTGALFMARLGRGVRVEYVVATFAWSAFAALLIARHTAGWRGRKTAQLTILGFTASLVVLGIYLWRHAAGAL